MWLGSMETTSQANLHFGVYEVIMYPGASLSMGVPNSDNFEVWFFKKCTGLAERFSLKLG